MVSALIYLPQLGQSAFLSHFPIPPTLYEVDAIRPQSIPYTYVLQGNDDDKKKIELRARVVTNIRIKNA
jgi:hypothetical protein